MAFVVVDNVPSTTPTRIDGGDSALFDTCFPTDDPRRKSRGFLSTIVDDVLIRLYDGGGRFAISVNARKSAISDAAADDDDDVADDDISPPPENRPRFCPPLLFSTDCSCDMQSDGMAPTNPRRRPPPPPASTDDPPKRIDCDSNRHARIQDNNFRR